MPGLCVILADAGDFSCRNRMHGKKHMHSDLMEAHFFDIAWDGAAID